MATQCRVCLSSKSDKTYYSLLSVFPEFSETSLCVLDLLTVVTSSKVPFTKNYPNLICFECYKALKQTYDFIILFQTSQATLTQNDDQNICIINEPSETSTKNETLDEDDSVFEEQIVIVTDNKEELGNEEQTDNERELSDNIVSNSEKKYSICSKNHKNSKNVIILSVEDVLKDQELEEGILKNVTTEEIELSETQEESFKSFIDNVAFTQENELEQTETTNLIKKSAGAVSSASSSPKILSVDDVLKVRKRTIKIKLKNEWEQNIFECDVCENKYDSLRKLTDHHRRVHNPEWQDKFKCNICSEQCKTVSAFRHHMRKHEGKKHACDQCDKVYLTKTMLREHIRRVHEQKLENKFLCPKCGKSFKFKNALEYHMNTHTNTRDFVCGFCGYKTITSTALKRHERIHTGERPYNCRYCAKSFAGSAERQKHEFGHKGIFPYQCKYCERRFIQTYNMRVHWLQHLGPCGCRMCGKSFIDTDVLKFHYSYAHKVKNVVIKQIKTE